MILNTIGGFFRSITFGATAAQATPPSQASNVPGASQYRSTSGSIPKEAQGMIAQVRNQIARSLAHPDPKTLSRLAEVNQKRQAKGQSPIDLQKVTKQLEAIQEDRGLSAKEKKQKVEALRKALGLSKGEMKGLFTQRLGRIYKAAEKSLAAFQKAKESQIKAELKQAEALHGKNSPQAQAVHNKLQALHAQLDPEKKRLAESGGFYRSLYPGFWSKLGGFFKKIGGGLLKAIGGISAVLRFLPGVGPLASRVLGSVKFLFQGFRVDKFFKNIGKGVIDTVRDWKSFLPMIPGVGTIASVAATGIEAVLKATRSGAKPF